MNSAPQVQTSEISDAELDAVAGGVAPHASVAAGPHAISDTALLAQAGAVKDQLLGAAGQFDQVSVTVSL